MPFPSGGSSESTPHRRGFPEVDDGDGRRIGRYRLAGRIATGGMAEVYLAVAGELTGFRTLVVVKRVLPHLASDRDFVRMFLDEARLATLLDHPNIARVVEIGREGGSHFLAIEAVHGLALSAVLSRSLKGRPSLSQAEIAFIIAQAAQGLGYAHRLTDVDGRPLNVVHRDVSPQNLLVSFEGTVKVIDFGVARALGQVSKTRPGQLKGKLAYMSPEQAATGHVDRRSDLFSLGVVLWELLCGERLFARTSDADTLSAIVDGQIAPPSRIVAIPSDLEDIVMRALEKDPARRFESAERMGLVLDRFAFATQGFDPIRIGATMRNVFAPEYQRWKARIAAALALKEEPALWPNPNGSPAPERGMDQQSGVPTAVLSRRALRPAGTPLVSPVPTARRRAGVGALSRREPKAVGLSLDGDGVRVWNAGVAVMVGAIALVCTGVGALGAARWRQRTTTPAAQGAPAARPADAIIIASTETRPTAPASLPQPPSPLTSEWNPEGGAAPPTVPDQWAPAATVPGTAEPGSSELRALATKRLHRPARTASTRRSRNVSPKQRTTAHPGRWPHSLCVIVVGTQPWSEVWIDGQNTNRHTPYRGAIPCGLHQLTFKRQDLGLARTIALSVHPGETVRRNVNLPR